jgi:hypothetical protein
MSPMKPRLERAESAEYAENVQLPEVENFFVSTVDPKNHTVNVFWKNSKGIVTEYEIDYTNDLRKSQPGNSDLVGDIVKKVFTTCKNRGELLSDDLKRELKQKVYGRLQENSFSRFFANIYFVLFGYPDSDKITTALDGMRKQIENKEAQGKDLTFIVNTLSNQKTPSKNREEIVWYLAALGGENLNTMDCVLKEILDEGRLDPYQKQLFLSELSNTGRCNKSKHLPFSILGNRETLSNDEKFSDKETETIIEACKTQPDFIKYFCQYISRRMEMGNLGSGPLNKEKVIELFNQVWDRVRDNTSINSKFLLDLAPEFKSELFKSELPRIAMDMLRKNKALSSNLSSEENQNLLRDAVSAQAKNVNKEFAAGHSLPLAEALLLRRGSLSTMETFTDEELEIIIKGCEQSDEFIKLLCSDLSRVKKFDDLVGYTNFSKLFTQLWGKVRDNPSIKAKISDNLKNNFQSELPLMASDMVKLQPSPEDWDDVDHDLLLQAARSVQVRAGNEEFSLPTYVSFAEKILKGKKINNENFTDKEMKLIIKACQENDDFIVLLNKYVIENNKLNHFNQIWKGLKNNPEKKLYFLNADNKNQFQNQYPRIAVEVLEGNKGIPEGDLDAADRRLLEIARKVELDFKGTGKEVKPVLKNYELGLELDSFLEQLDDH